MSGFKVSSIRSKKSKSRWSIGASWLMTALIIASCSPAKNTLITECVSNADQAALFKGHWTTRPVPLAIEVNDFNATEIGQLQAAIQTWNDFYMASKGFQLYLNNSSPLGLVSAGGTRMTSATACSRSLVGPSGFTNKIMIYKTSAGWTFGTSVMALTSLCPVVTSGSTYRTFISAVMELNYTNYFVAGKPLPDLQSIVTHELGHMLGLDHSCNGSGCANAPDDYRTAIMYPALGFSGINGEIKRTLQTNDQQRANCLY